ncbi:LytR/AlgR family response regulator transcription factor [Aquimarina sediminis]|uniref:LytR/AlgR family response regulator transcription factor n=1 Tax=Aquimarina sediminis TaxID=2070536 RepID=UPI000CA042D2|nr:LytTR family DNA-binding domain-containing protein [Aquimarina sediminis]
MNSIKCIIVDDEPLALDVISDYIGRLDFLSEVGKFDDALSAIEFLNSETVDLIFLDIQMPLLNGINFVKAISPSPKVIFTTAHRNYAVDGFELNAVDYLIKPIPFFRFVRAVEKIRTSTDYYTEIADTSSSNAAFFKVDNKKIKVYYNDILLIESLKDYIKVVLKDRFFVTYQTLSGMLEMLPSSSFVQVHKSFIVNYHHIKVIQGNILKIEDYTIPMGRIYRDEALEKIYQTGKKAWK